MIKHIIFDCFGTLIDTGSGSLEAVRHILANINYDVDVKSFYSDWKRTKKDMMNSPDFINEKTLFEVSLANVFADYCIHADASKEVTPMIQSLFGDRHIFSDVNDTLRKLSDRGVEFAIGSTTDTDSLMHFLKLNNLNFSHIYTSEDMRVYKPDKQFYEIIMNKSGWNVKECLFVGDSYVDDVWGPKKIGMRAVLIDRKGEFNIDDVDIKPDYVIGSRAELVDIV